MLPEIVEIVKTNYSNRVQASNLIQATYPTLGLTAPEISDIVDYAKKKKCVLRKKCKIFRIFRFFETEQKNFFRKFFFFFVVSIEKARIKEEKKKQLQERKKEFKMQVNKLLISKIN